MKSLPALSLPLFALALMFSSCSQNAAESSEQSDPQPALMEREISYQGDSVTMQGYLVYDSSSADLRPGVLVVHEWWGHNEHARESARKLARLGYTALAVDMFGDGAQASHPEKAMEFSGALMQDPEGAKLRFIAAMETLMNEAPTQPDNLGAIGYCFGGGVVLNMARQGLPLDAVVSFHGSLMAIETARPGQTKARLLVLNGEADPLVPVAEQEAFMAEMDAAGVDYQFVNYPGALHAFTNPSATAMGEKFSLPLAYQAAADSLSWAEMTRFLDASFNR